MWLRWRRGNFLSWRVWFWWPDGGPACGDCFVDRVFGLVV